MYCQHAIALNEHYLEYNPTCKGYSAPLEFAKLMGWCSWYVPCAARAYSTVADGDWRYLFEVADFTNFQRLHTGGMKAFEEVPPDTVDKAARALLNYNAGTVETTMGMFEKAKLSLDEALRVRRTLANVDDITATLNNLGLLHGSTHEFDLAERYYSEALKTHLTRPDTPDRNLSLTMVKHNLQRNAIQRGTNLPTIDDLQATVDFFKSSASWWMTGQWVAPLPRLLHKPLSTLSPLPSLSSLPPSI